MNIKNKITLGENGKLSLLILFLVEIAPNLNINNSSYPICW